MGMKKKKKKNPYPILKTPLSKTTGEKRRKKFCDFFKKRSTSKSDKKLPFLYTIARNLCIEEYRKGSKEKTCEINEELSYDPTQEWIDSIAIKKTSFTNFRRTNRNCCCFDMQMMFP